MRIFILYSKSQVNSFFKSGVLEELVESSNLDLMIGSLELLPNEYSKISFKELQKLNPVLARISGLVQMCALWRYKDRSMNHTVRAFASFGSKQQRQQWNCVVVSEMNVSFIKRLIIRMLSRSPFFEGLRLVEATLRHFMIRGKILNQFRNYTEILIPFSGHIGIDFGTYVWIAKKLRIKSIGIQENWDNLSTKTFITDEPDYFFVWGNQSAGHIRSIHKMRSTIVRVIGSPRFTDYYFESNPIPVAATPSGDLITISKPFVLIGGTGDGIDDEILLSTTYSSLSGNLTEIDVVYRPHPMSRTMHNLRSLQHKYPHLIIDAGEGASHFGHQIPLVQNCFVLLNHFSTLTLEGLIAGTQVVVPLFLGRESAKYRYENILNEWHHMSGISLLGNLHLPASVEDFGICLRESFRKRNENRIPETIDWFCRKSHYSKEILKTLEALPD
jgi:hypothetical protein